MAAGGKGAPLVPFLDYILFRHGRRGRMVQNIGGIANLTAIPAGATPEQVIAFDTGPGNMVIDQLMERLFGRRLDRDGRTAARGTALEIVVSEVLRGRFFRRKPPRTAGREEFGREFADWFQQRCGRARKEDVIATATALTARSIGEAIRLVLRGEVLRGKQPETSSYRDYFVSGGGTRNATLMRLIASELEPLGFEIHASDEAGLPSPAKEAVAFALLAYQTWHREPSNLPSATGAVRPAILGKISYV
jgi:anhydro-N-acetylmuramic acid kinase